MRKSIILITLIFGFTTSYSQELSTKFTLENFETQVLNYSPKKIPNVSDKDYNYGIMILNETKEAVKNKPGNFNLADYFNILNAFLSLKETKENVNVAFKKFVAAKGSCEYIIAFESSIKSNPKYDIVREDYNQQLNKCRSNTDVKKELDISEYAKLNNLNFSLIEKIYNVNINDQKYRSYNGVKKIPNGQQVLDKKNQAIIDSLYKTNKTYIGRSLVGKKFENVMWAVVQHSNAEMMERYLPVIKKAVFDKEIEVAPLKMLIDRFYGLKYGYQIFGSQGDGFGFKSADEKTKKEVKMKYGIE
ncbi:MAG: hypothetical protein EOO20_03465 [Chryseobacterium sp.]|nr:MAG: hypothetical protein EOO20_03465 [Chryseobacterium sp.]